jgi:hypothetical protein
MATAQIEFVYSLSKPVTENSAPATPPTTTNPTGDGTRDRPYTYILPDGHLRIWWMKPGGDFNSRNPNSIAANLPEAGNLIPTKTAFPISRLVDINDWNNKPGETERIVTLYLEAVRPSSAIGDQLIEVNYYKNGLGKKAKTQKEIYTAVRVESMTPQENTMLMLPEAQKTVTAKITPALACVPVYFEVIDPDDQSPYEWVGGDRARGQDVLPNDNFGLSSVYDYATFQSNINKRKAYTTTSDGIASISLQPVLPSTGDNYKVRASCCEPKSLLKKFDNWSDSSKNGKYHRSTIVESGTTVVWKTVYIEMDKMYKNGATIISTTPNNVSEIAVDNIADFSAQKDKVAVIFYPDGTEKEVTVKDVVGSSIKIESNEQLSIPQYSGIRMKGEDAVYEVSDRLLKSAFGDEQNIAGTDGGAFTKFTIVEGGRNLPKYAQFIDNEERFADAWLVHKENHNVIRIIPASRITNDRSGCSYYVGKYVFVASNIKGNLVNEMNKSETLVHELGHLVGPLTSAEFELGELGIGIDPNSHVDMHVDYPNIHFYDYGWTAITASFTRLTDKSFRIEGLTAAKLLVKRTKIRYRGTVDTYNYGEVSSVSYNNGVTTIMFTDTSSPMDTSHASVLEYFPGDQCVMSYNRKRGTGFAAFCEKCLIEIRKRDLYTK